MKQSTKILLAKIACSVLLIKTLIYLWYIYTAKEMFSDIGFPIMLGLGLVAAALLVKYLLFLFSEKQKLKLSS